jgi:hypothetical protein
LLRTVKVTIEILRTEGEAKEAPTRTHFDSPKTAEVRAKTLLGRST